MFHGFSQETIDFMWGIRLNNDRSWFLAHKQEYQRYVEQPMREIAQQLHEKMDEKYPRLDLQCKVSRIYRDARRLHGRGPFKDVLWMSLQQPTQDKDALPCFYFEITPTSYGYGMGCHCATPLMMAKLRTSIDNNPAPLEKLARKLARQDEFVLNTQSYKRPKGNPSKTLYSWYNSKNLVLSSEHNCEGLFFQPELLEQVFDGFCFLQPYYAYMMQVCSMAAPSGEN